MNPFRFITICLMMAAASFGLVFALYYFDDAQVAALMAGGRVSLGVGVTVAYFPIVARFRLWSVLRVGEVLSLGIFVAWAAQILFGLLTLYAQMGYGQLPSWVIAVTSLVSIFSGVLHLAAARAVDGRIPLISWMRAGSWAAVGTATVLTSILVINGS